MSTQNPTKKQLLKAIAKLEKNPHDRVAILADIGVVAIGAAGAGAGAAIFGATTAVIPIIGTTVILVAAPVSLVAGAAVAGGAAIYGATRLIKNGGFHKGKRKEILRQLQEKLRELDQQEQQLRWNKEQQNKIYSMLKGLIEYDVITPADTQQFIQKLEEGDISVSEAYQLLEDLVAESVD